MTVPPDGRVSLSIVAMSAISSGLRRGVGAVRHRMRGAGAESTTCARPVPPLHRLLCEVDGQVLEGGQLAQRLMGANGVVHSLTGEQCGSEGGERGGSGG